MNDQETPVKEAPPEGHGSSTEERKPEEQPRPATTPPHYEHGWPTTPPPYVPPYTQSPYTWPSYVPATARRDGGPYAPSYTRQRSNWPWITLVLVLLFVFVIGGAFFLLSSVGNNFGSTSTTTQHYTVNTNPTIVLNNDTGSIHVRAGGSGSDVTILATKHTGWLNNGNDANVTYTQDKESNIVTVNVERPNNTSFVTSTSVDFDLTIPGTAFLQLKTNTGSIDVSGVSGQMVLTSNTGSIQVSSAALSGMNQLITNTGSVNFTGSIGQTGTYQFQTNTGSVNVTIPATSAFHLNASTDTGSINTNFPSVTIQHHQFVGADAQGDVGNAPQATITLRTNTGSINLYQG